ncbi:MAG: hypothetical protein AB7Q29_14750 [Vicinamibacterales bacterium]
MSATSRFLPISVTAALLASAGIALAQGPAPAPRFEVGAQVAVTRSGEFDSSDTGLGMRGAWRPSTRLGLEGEINLFPGDYAGSTPFSSHRLEGLFGATAGPQIGRVRPFGRARAGFLRLASAPEPLACIAIVPPPLTCSLASGKTLFVLDLGGGVQGRLTSRTFWRVDVGDRLVRYPGPTVDRDLESRDAFFGHDFRIAAGGGFTF